MSIVTPAMQDLAKEAKYKWQARAPAVLLPYQQRWLADKSKVKVVEKSRRIGLSWAEACDAVLCAAATSGQDVWYIGYVKDMAIEFILDCAQWAEHFQSVADAVEIEEEVFIQGEERKSVFAFSIRFASGNRITALSSRPRNLRGKQGRVILDEAAFHEDQAGILKAAMALLIWGGDLRVISTHDGDENPFNELVTDIRAGKAPYALHRITFEDALRDGLHARVCLRTGQPATPEAEAAWAAEIRAFYRDSADEELDCIPKNGSATWLSRALIERCMNPELPVVRLEKKPEFTFLPERQRQREIHDWCEEHLRPLLDKLPPELRSSLGGDIGRTGDLTVFVPLLIEQKLRRRSPFIVELRGLPFDAQQQILYYILDRLPRFDHAAIDSRGLGHQIAEQAAQRYGQLRVTQVMLSEAWYLANMPPVKAAFEDRDIELCADADVMEDLRSVVVVKGVARVPDLRRADAQKKKRHGDAAIAVALGWFASRQDGGPVHVASSAGSRPDSGLAGQLEGYLE